MIIKNMIEELIELGLSQGSIADAVGTTQPTIHRALNGADIRYTTGKAIESLYAQRVRRGRIQAEIQERRDGDRRQADRREGDRREGDRRA